jgi:hypothetical protein
MDGVMFIPRSSDNAGLGIEELGLPGYPQVPLRPASYRQVAGGCRVNMYVGCDRASIADRDVGHGWLGCFAPGSGHS